MTRYIYDEKFKKNREECKHIYTLRNSVEFLTNNISLINNKFSLAKFIRRISS